MTGSNARRRRVNPSVSRADGTLPPEAWTTLSPIGRWFKKVDRGFRHVEYATHRFAPDHMLVGRDIEVTQQENTLYVSLTGVPAGNRVLLKPVQ